MMSRIEKDALPLFLDEVIGIGIHYYEGKPLRKREPVGLQPRAGVIASLQVLKVLAASCVEAYGLADVRPHVEHVDDRVNAAVIALA